MSIWRSPHLGAVAALLVLGLVSVPASAAPFRLDPAFPAEPLAGPTTAKGAVIWSHGRSVTAEDSLSPTPRYIGVLREGGWDAFRFNRSRDADTLADSAHELSAEIGRLKQQGYREIVLAGQSFGAFLSLMAADASADVHAVIATAPAAFGNFDDFYGSWQENATRLYPLLEGVRSARIMLFFFHGDDFDPGGRGEHARAILAARGIDNLVIDQPRALTGHWAASSAPFASRFGDCIRDFVETDSAATLACIDRWGK